MFFNLKKESKVFHTFACIGSDTSVEFSTFSDGFPYLNEHLEQYIMSPNYPDPYPNNYEEVI